MNVDDPCLSSSCTRRLENSVLEFINTTADRKSVTCITAEVLLTLLRKKEHINKVCPTGYVTFMARVKQSMNDDSNDLHEVVHNPGHANDFEIVIPPEETKEEEQMEQVNVLELRNDFANFDSQRNLRDYSHNLK